MNPLDGILAAISFALRATVHTTTQYMPTQMVFGRDHILNLKQAIDWKTIKENKSTLIQKTMKEKTTRELNTPTQLDRKLL